MPPSPRTKALAVTVVFGVLALAGCIGGGDAPSTDATPSDDSGPAGFDESTGGIEGFVTDEEGLPVTGAQVAVLETDRAGVSDAAGRFAFSNVDPGRHAVAVQRLGYEAAVQTVEVMAGQVAKVQFQLKAIVVRTAYSTSFTQTGYFECSWMGIVSAGGPCFFPITGTNTSIVPVDPWTNNKRQFDYPVDAGLSTVLNEMTWTQTTAATGDQMSVFLSYQDRPGSHWYCYATSPSPVQLRWDRGDIDDDEGTCNTGDDQLPDDTPQTVPLEGQVLTSRANTGPGDVPAIEFGMAVQQSFEITFTMFYWEAAPPAYTGLGDQ